MKELFGGAVRQKAHKHTATAVSRDLERAVAGLWKGRERECPGRGRRRAGGKQIDATGVLE